MRKRPVPLVAVVTAAVLGAVALLGAAVVVFAGLYDVASTTQHWQVTHSLLETTMQRSVQLRARDIAEPPLADQAMALRGAGCFRDRCVQCHGGTGVPPDGIGRSMQPLPGPLLDASVRWRPRELYWLTRHGIRMSGMPAWEFRLEDREIWELVAFLQRLPRLDAAQYADWMRRAPPAPACGREPLPAVAGVTDDIERGRQALHQYGCNGCHVIPGVTGPRATVGPTLEGMGSRRLVAGQFPNTPANLARWIMAPQELKPGSIMPAMGVTEQDAQQMARYLATLR